MEIHSIRVYKVPNFFQGHLVLKDFLKAKTLSSLGGLHSKCIAVLVRIRAPLKGPFGGSWYYQTWYQYRRNQKVARGPSAYFSGRSKELWALCAFRAWALGL